MSVPQPSPYPQPGEVIDGKYKVERLLGQGGMGAVVKAVHVMLRAPMALKFMNPQYIDLPGAVARFLNEGVASKAIASDHVLHVNEVGKLPSGAPYLVMDCLDGRDLSQLLEAEGKPGLPAVRAVGFVIQILRALQAAHATNIIHRDMKPSNCFVIRKDDDDDFVKILDFGISKIQQPDSQALTQTHSALGTPLYMSPEQARSPKEVDGRSDIYSVAVILYELLSGRTPFTTDSGQLTELLFKLFTADPDPLDEIVSDLPAGLWDVVKKGLARDPINRYSSALLMAEALEPFADAKGQALIGRMRKFVAPEDAGKHSRALPPSEVAFLELGKGQSFAGHTEIITTGPSAIVAGPAAIAATSPALFLGPSGTHGEPARPGSTSPQAGSAPPGPSVTIAMADRPDAVGGITGRPSRPQDVTYPRPAGEGAEASFGTSSAALAATRGTTDTEGGKSSRMLVTGAGIALVAVLVAVIIGKVTAPPAAVGMDPSRASLPPTVTATPSAAPSSLASAPPSASASSPSPHPSMRAGPGPGTAPKPTTQPTQPTHVLQTGIQN